MLLNVQTRTNYFLTAFVGFVAVFSATLFPKYLIYAVVMIFIVHSIFNSRNNVKVSKTFFVYMIFFLAPSILSLLSLIPSFIINTHSLSYGELNIFGRLSNLVIFIFLVLMLNFKNKNEHQLLVFQWYWIGGIVFVLLGYWHAAYIFGFVGKWPFETRSHIHSALGAVLPVSSRVTGIAHEPSFFGPLVVDFIILTLLLVRGMIKKIAVVALSLIIIILSLSPSGYLVLVGSIVSGVMVLQIRALRPLLVLRFNIITLLSTSLLVIFALIILFYGQNFSIFEYIYTRFINVQESGRFYMVAMPFNWSAEGGTFSFLFGNGLKTFSIIGTQFYLPSGSAIHVTSNNFYVDIFWEAGLVGLVITISFYVYLFIKILNSKYSTHQIFIAAMLFGNLVFSNFVRADYASIRTFVLLYLLFLLTHSRIEMLKASKK